VFEGISRTYRMNPTDVLTQLVQVIEIVQFGRAPTLPGKYAKIEIVKSR
jgi:hypothetical protein